MNRPWHVWMVFGACLVVVMAAMAWLSFTVLRLENAEAEARRAAHIEENARLALWRMDSALAPLIAQESARPYFLYSPFYPAERAYTRMYHEIDFGEVLVPSPLLTQGSEYVLLHFQLTADGEVSSPQVPTGRLRSLAVPQFATEEKIEAAVQRLAELRGIVNGQALAAGLPLQQSKPVSVARVPLADMRGARVQRQGKVPQQAERNWVEQQARGRAVQQMADVSNSLWNAPATAEEVLGGPVAPLWIGDELLLARRVTVDGREYVQGCWLDWAAVERWLCGEVSDLFAGARLQPCRRAEAGGGRMLAALPVCFVPGAPSFDLAAARSPLGVSLLIAWCCALLAGIAVVVLLTGTLALSERRAAFVSAVTHELRTPLTTFRLYTEMLVEGLVPEEARRREYLQTLQAEANRLSHLVENVLSYARLERRRADGHTEVVAVADLLERAAGRLGERAQQAGMSLVIEPAGEMRVRADVSAVEQILFNLVDNACKYAAGANLKQIEVSAASVGGAAVVRVRDHGPGIAAADARRLFRPFHKSARDAAHSAPGVGLGLALSRRLARAMGGDLRLAQASGAGACFELRLPLG